ncbi:multiubiquitin domain-containing protein [uncultured Gimesia sp.]|uniref:multiubiquitin domain-containing protein n=1 Tax=uncultured Gimesia sp. TaxID=1678688 RepID=UPI0030DA247A|tara:strand:+ start:13083 stop:13847 length:765 start_codon:yes stop_codon:yes gene_type:complete
MEPNQTTTEDDVVDIGAAIRAGRAVREASAYRIKVSKSDLEFRSVILHDPVPLGRQIAETAGVDDVREFSVFAILKNGDFEDLRLDEPFDLRAKGAERFVLFRTDREYKLTINDDQVRWGKPLISGAELIRLAEPEEGDAIYLEVRGGEDEQVVADDVFDLDEAGIERFITAKCKPVVYEIFVNARPKTVPDKTVTYSQIVALAFPGPHDDNVLFSMTFRKAASKPHTGELSLGGTVEVKKKGTVFNVSSTVQS